MRSILILVADLREHERRNYFIKRVATLWQEAGVAVEVIDRLPARADADLVVNHVDRTVTPPDVAAFLARCPRTLNGRVLDISKRATADGLVHGPGDGAAPVIVKTDLNSTGGPEALARPRGPWQRRLARLRRWAVRAGLAPILDRPLPATPYQIFGSTREVPPGVWRDRRLVVQPFRPEREGDAYAVRLCFFLGGRSVVLRVFGDRPVVKSSAVKGYAVLQAEPPAIAALRARLGMGYGKIDYVEHDGQVFVLDVNRTPVRRRPTERPPTDRAQSTPPYDVLAEGLGDL